MRKAEVSYFYSLKSNSSRKQLLINWLKISDKENHPIAAISALIIMCLSNCSQCKYFDCSPHHWGDIVCAINPAYAETWKRLKSLDDYSKSCLPIDVCTDFELDPRLEKKAIAFDLNISDWQKLIWESSLPTITQSLNKVLFNYSLYLTSEDWQRVANHTSIPHVSLTLANAGIRPQQNRWIHVDSSCINAIAYTAIESRLKIRFIDGIVYQYDRVEESLFDNFCNAPSKSEFFHDFILDNYDYSVINVLGNKVARVAN